MLLSNMIRRHQGITRSSTLQPATSTTVPNTVVDDSDGLIPFLTRQDGMNDRDPRINAVIDGGLVHATHLSEICPRQIALHRKAGNSLIHHRRVDSNARLIWATGRAFEEHVRLQLVNSFNRESVIGEFQCKCGVNKQSKDYNGIHRLEGHVPFNLSPDSSRVCNSCNTPVDRYIELPIILTDDHVIASPDFGYFNQSNQGVVLEIKSLKKESSSSYRGFDTLEAAKVENIRQAFLYHKAAVKNGADMADYVVIMYVSKGWVNPNESPPYKEFVVRISDHQHIYDALDQLIETGRIIGSIDSDGNVSDEYDSGDGLPSKVCSDSNCTTAKNCPMSGLCFSISGGLVR